VVVIGEHWKLIQPNDRGDNKEKNDVEISNP
jgi:hypothetical protein